MDRATSTRHRARCSSEPRCPARENHAHGRKRGQRDPHATSVTQLSRRATLRVGAQWSTPPDDAARTRGARGGHRLWQDDLRRLARVRGTFCAAHARACRARRGAGYSKLATHRERADRADDVRRSRPPQRRDRARTEGGAHAGARGGFGGEPELRSGGEVVHRAAVWQGLGDRGRRRGVQAGAGPASRLRQLDLSVRARPRALGRRPVCDADRYARDRGLGFDPRATRVASALNGAPSQRRSAGRSAPPRGSRWGLVEALRECEGFVHERDLVGAGAHDEPLLHHAAVLARIETLAGLRLDELVDARLWQLHDEAVLADAREDLRDELQHVVDGASAWFDDDAAAAGEGGDELASLHRRRVLARNPIFWALRRSSVVVACGPYVYGTDQTMRSRASARPTISSPGESRTAAFAGCAEKIVWTSPQNTRPCYAA